MVGVYTCQATNTALGQNVADTVTLSVLCKFVLCNGRGR